MKYCQNCKVMLQDEVEVCPVCGKTQLPTEEYEAKCLKKKKSVKTLIIVIAAVIVAALAVLAVIMIFGKAPKKTVTDEKYVVEVTDQELLTQFAAYIVTVIPAVWESTDESTESAIEYYKTDFPEVTVGFEQMKEIKPLVGAVENVHFSGAATSEDGEYRLMGSMDCADGKVDYTLKLGASGYVDGLSFEQREVPFLEKARDAILNVIPEDF